MTTKRMNQRITRNIELLEYYINDLKKALEHNNTEDTHESVTDAQMTLEHIKELIVDNI
jgi:hypothetical protein